MYLALCVFKWIEYSDVSNHFDGRNQPSIVCYTSVRRVILDHVVMSQRCVIIHQHSIHFTLRLDRCYAAMEENACTLSLPGYKLTSLTGRWNFQGLKEVLGCFLHSGSVQ